MFQKVFKLLIALIIVMSTVIPSALAEDAAETNEKSRQMIDFFRDDRALDVENTTQDEMKVYGVFLSNFMIPFSTKLGDLDGDEISKKVSTKFFGNDGQVETVKAINSKIEEAIVNGFKNSSADYSLHYSVSKAKAGEVLTGKQLLNILAGTKTNRNIYNSKGTTILDLNAKGTHGAIKVLFGLYPREFVGETRLLRNIKGLYIDGLGNIWGAKELNAPQEDYILILPAVLNPVTYTGKTTGGIPLNNVFSMGAMLQINGGSAVIDNSKLVAYYNVPKLFGNGNMTSIYGIETDNPIFGKLYTFMKGDLTSTYTYAKALAFSEKDMEGKVNLGTTRLLISTDFDAHKDIVGEDLVGVRDEDGDVAFAGKSDDGTTYTSRKEVAGGFVKYMGETLDYSLKDNQVIDSMYFFDTSKTANSEVGADSTYGTWDDLDSIMKSSLYYYEPTDGNVRFHSGSYFLSKLGKLLVDYKGKDSTTVTKGLKTKFTGLKEGDLTDNDAEDLGLQSIYTTVTGKGTINTTSGAGYQSRWSSAFASFYEYPVSIGFSQSMAMKNELLTNKNFLGIGNDSAFGEAGALADDKKYVVYSQKTWLDVDTYGQPNKYVAQQMYSTALYRIFTGHTIWSKVINSGTSVGDASKTDANGNKMVARSRIADGVNHYPGIYWAYMVDILDVKSVNGKMTSSSWSNSLLPTISIAVNGSAWDINSILESGGVLSTEEKTLEEQQKDIIRKTTALLSTEFDEVRNQILRSTQNGFLIETHRSIIGSNMGSAFDVSANSSKAYATTVGYINSPKVSDLPLIDWFIKDYIFVFVFMMTIVIMVLVMLTFLRIRSLKQSLVIFAVMCFVMYLPQFVVGNSVSITNSISDRIFSERFNYWALVQHEYRVQNSAEEIAGDNEYEYILMKNIQQAEDAYDSDGGVRVKWMSPKKDDVFEDMFSEGRMDSNLQSQLTIFKWLFSSYFYEEQLSADRLDTFIYRPYNAIANNARTNYDSYLNTTKPSMGTFNSGISAYKSNMTTLPSYRFLLASDSNRKISYGNNVKELIKKSSTYISNLTLKETQTAYRYWGLTDTKVTHAILRDRYNETEAGVEEGTTKDYEAFLLNSESPYYYFYNVIKSNYTVDGSGFKDALLREEYFKVTNVDKKVNGYTRDFLDLEGLFTYVVPYLYQGNEYVKGWGSKYGLDVPTFNFNAEDVVITNGTDASVTQKFNDSKTKKENLRKVWRLYSPWVAQLYNEENIKNRIKVNGKNRTVADAMNPGAYQDVGRDMIFSEADMYAKSYNIDALSQAEIKIQRFQEATYKDLMYLINYRDLSDEVLISMAAMTATFNFNQEFSDYNMLSESSELYPQAFELTNFNYDAFLRLMLLNTTGEPIYIEGDDDLYVRVLEKTSWFTGIVLIVKDITAIYLIPMARIVVLMMLFFLTLLYSFSLILSQPKDVIKKTALIIGKPLLTYVVATIAFAFVMSMFVGDGYDSYVGSQTASFELNDPTITLIFATLVDLVFVYVLFLLIKQLWGTIKQYGGGSIGQIAGLVGNTAQQVTKGVKSTVGGGGKLLSGLAKTPAKAYKTNKKRNEYNREVDNRADLMGNIGRIADNTDVSAGRLTLEQINNMAGARREDKAKEVATAGGKKVAIKGSLISKLRGKAQGSKETGDSKPKEEKEYKTQVKKTTTRNTQQVSKRKKKRK